MKISSDIRMMLKACNCIKCKDKDKCNHIDLFNCYAGKRKEIKPSTMPMWNKKSPAGVYEKVKVKTSGWKK